METNSAPLNGRKIECKAPGPAARIAVQGAFSASEWQELQDIAPEGNVNLLKQGDLTQPMWQRWLQAMVAYTCACTVAPRVWPTLPVPDGAIYYDDLSNAEWDQLQRNVQELAAKKKPVPSA